MRRFWLGVPAFCFVLSFFVAGVGVEVRAQAKHPFTFEDMMKLKRVGEPEVSPDGKWVIFSVVDVDLAANTKTPHVWIVPAAGGEEREIIADQDADRPRWAPDGKSFAFLSTQNEGSQIWVAGFDGSSGSVTGKLQATHIKTEAGGELWSPDGKTIIFTSDVYPECDGQPAEEDACNEKKLKDAEQSKVKAQIFTHLLYRHWNAYREGKRSHIFVAMAPTDALKNQAVGVDKARPRDLTPGDFESPVFSLGGQDDYAFSPDGQEICYASNHDKNPAASTNNDLWIVPITGGAAKDITADNPASDSTPLYSPDGKYIAYRAQKRPGYEADRFQLMLYDRKTGEKKSLTENLDAWVGSFIWNWHQQGDIAAVDGLYYTVEQAGQVSIYASGLTANADAAPAPLVASGTDRAIVLSGSNAGTSVPVPNLWGYVDDLALGPNGSLIFTCMTIHAPNEICTTRPFSAAPDAERKALTHFNDGLFSQVAMSPVESFWFQGAHGDKVEGFVVKPPNFDASKKYPLKFLIHGGPQGAWGDDWSYRWNPELFASPTSATPGGYVVVMINFHGSTGYGQKFTDAINQDWGGAPFEDLMKGLDFAEAHYPFIDKTRECALGASYGGYMANWILGHTDRFKCIVSHDGMFNAFSAWGTTEELWFNDWEFGGTPYTAHDIYNKWSPRNSATNFKTPTLVIHSQRDYRLDVSEGLQLFTTLQMMGVPSKMLYFPDEGHWVLKPQNSQLWYKTVNDWVDQWTSSK